MSSLVGWSRNPNRHPASQIAQLTRAFRRFGFVNPCTVANIIDEGVLEVRAGHGRIEALASVLAEDPAFVPHGAPSPGIVRCVVHDFATRAQANAYGLADNRLAAIAEPDEDAIAEILRGLEEDAISLDGLGWADDDMTALLAGPSFDPILPDQVPQLDQAKLHQCPHCKGTFTYGDLIAETT